MDKKIQIEEIQTDFVARVSNQNQEVLNGSMVQQINLINQYIENLNKRSLHKKYVLRKVIQEVVSGQAQYFHKRKEIIQLEKDVLEGKVKAVVVEKLDRLSRDQIFLLEFPRFLIKHGCEFHEVESGQLDLRKREHRFSHTFKSYMSNEYIEDLSQKKKTKNRAAMFFSGKDVSTNPVLGLDPHPEFACVYVINEKESLQVQDLVQFFIQSQSYKLTADYGNTKGYLTKEKIVKEKIDKNGHRVPPKRKGGEPLMAKYVRGLFNSPKARGFGTFKDDNDDYVEHRNEFGIVTFKYSHPPVITPEQAIQIDHIQSLSNKHYSPNNDFLLAGILEYEGGLNVRGNSALSNRFKDVKRKYRYYEVVLSDGKKQRFSAPSIEKQIIKRLKLYVECNETFLELFKKSHFTESSHNDLKKKILSSKANLKKLKTSLDTFNQNLTKVMSDSGFSKEALLSLLDRKTDLENEIEFENNQLKSLEKLSGSLCDESMENTFRGRLKDFIQSFDLLADCDKKKVIQSLFPKIILEGDSRIRIFLNPAFEGLGDIKSDKFLDEKWRVRRSSSELFTPSLYLTDTISLMTDSLEIDPSSLQQKYKEKGLSLRQISAETFHSRQAISEVLKASGVHIRAPGQGHGNPSQLKFGYKKERGSVVPHLGEQQVIGAIKDLRGEGMTFRQIAQRMTALRIPSKNGKLKWHPMMVKRVLHFDTKHKSDNLL